MRKYYFKFKNRNHELIENYFNSEDKLGEEQYIRKSNKFILSPLQMNHNGSRNKNYNSYNNIFNGTRKKINILNEYNTLGYQIKKGSYIQNRNIPSDNISKIFNIIKRENSLDINKRNYIYKSNNIFKSNTNDESSNLLNNYKHNNSNITLKDNFSQKYERKNIEKNYSNKYLSNINDYTIKEGDINLYPSDIKFKLYPTFDKYYSNGENIINLYNQKNVLKNDPFYIAYKHNLNNFGFSKRIGEFSSYEKIYKNKFFFRNEFEGKKFIFGLSNKNSLNKPLKMSH